MKKLLPNFITLILILSLVYLMNMPDLNPQFVSPLGMPSPEGYIVYAEEPTPTPTPKFEWNYTFSSSVHEAIKDNFNQDQWLEAEQVIMCESSGKPNAKSDTSTAGGLFQILNGTWNWLECDGDKHNAHDNAKCAAKLYNLYGWGSSASWQASKHCHKLN